MNDAAPSAGPLGEIKDLIGFIEPTPKRRHVVSDLPEGYWALMVVGRRVLQARGPADLNARLNQAMAEIRGLDVKTRRAPPDAPNVFPEEPSEDSVFVAVLGRRVARKFLKAARESLPIGRVVSTLWNGGARETLALRALSVTPWSLHDGAVVPHALVESAIIQARGGIALGALVAAGFDGRAVKPWLGNALAEAFLAMVREGTRLLASAGLDAGPWHGELVDIAALFRDAEEADAKVMARFASGDVVFPADE